MIKPAAGYLPLAYSSPEAVQTTGMPAPVRQLALAIVALFSLSHAADSAGFAIDDQSARSLGTANAGSAAAAEDASTIPYNPAGITRLEKPELTASATIVNAALPFTNGGSALATGASNLGRNDDGGTVGFLPNLFAASPLAPNLAVGLGMFPSFGLKTDYRRGWVGRYEAESTELASLDFTPTLAYRLTHVLSVGGGPVARYSQAKLSNSIDFGSLGVSLGVPGSIPGQTDGNVKIRGSDWSLGFNVGILIEPSPETRLGVAYFYNHAAKLSGTAEFERPEVANVISAASGAFVQTGAAARPAYPDRLNFGVVHAVSPALDVRVGLTWTRWHSSEELRIHFDNPNQPDAVTNDNWRDQLAYAVGATYRVDPAFALRAGVSYDQTPVPDAYREPRIPDTDRLMLAIGAGYVRSEDTRIDVAYEHIFNNTGLIHVSSPSGDQLIGKTRPLADIFALQLTLRY